MYLLAAAGTGEYICSRMKDSLEIYVQPGERGFHAGARGHARVWAAHPDDMETAAWKCAMRRWFPKRANGVLLYREVQAVTLDKLEGDVWRATLHIENSAVPAFQFARDFTPELPIQPRKRSRVATKRKK